jgi:transcriptional regulator
MYNPSTFAEDRSEILHEFIRQHPFAAVVSCGTDGPEATHVPLVLHADVGARGVLRCHIARANRHWESLRSSPAVLVIVPGPQHYITPAWYPSKREHGKVVPTWNYVAVHIRGRATLFEDQQNLLNHLRALTEQRERALGSGWSIDDAPDGFIEATSKAIVGIEIAIESIEGKWKASQNRPEADRQGVIEGLEKIDSSESCEMARIVEERRRKSVPR